MRQFAPLDHGIPAQVAYNDGVIRPVLAAGSLLGIAAGPAVAEDERALSFGVGLATFSAPGEAMPNMEPPAVSPTGGGVASASFERMIGTDIGLRAELAAGVFRGGNSKKQSATSYALIADAGVVFRFDILEYVPYAFGGLGAVASGGGPIDRDPSLVLVVGGGLDWLRGRTHSYGAELRLASFGGDVTVFTFAVRGTLRWGFF